MKKDRISGLEIESPSPSVRGGLKLRVSYIDLGLTDQMVVEVRGKVPLQSQWVYSAGFVTSLFDCTNDRYLPIRSLIQDLQEESTNSFQLIKKVGELNPLFKFDAWNEVAFINRGFLEGPFEYTRNLLAVVRLVDLESDFQIRHGQLQSRYGIIWTGMKRFEYRFSDEGYMNEYSWRRNLQFICIKLALLVAAKSGSIRTPHIKILRRKIDLWLHQISDPFEVYDGQSHENRTKSYDADLNKAIDQAKKGKINQSRILTELDRNYDPHMADELIELCFEVMTIEGHANTDALELIDEIAELLEISHERLTNIRDDRIVKLDTSSELDAPVEKLLGMNQDWSHEQKVKHLKAEFHKWNSRLNVVPEGEARENAQRMLDMISGALQEYK